MDGDGEPTATGPIGWSIALLPRTANPRVANGIHVAVSSWQRPGENAMPVRVKATANYNNGRLSGLQGRVDGYDSVIPLTGAGHVAESPGSCVFIVRDGRLMTSSVADHILESITRATVMEQAARDLGLTVVERPIGRTELHAATEAFFCGSGSEIQPILSIDRLPVGVGDPGPLTRAIQQRCFATVRGEVPEYRHGLAPVFGGA